MSFRFKVKGDPKVDAAYPWLATLEHRSISICILMTSFGFALTYIDSYLTWVLGGLFLGLGAGQLIWVGALRTLLTKQVAHD